MLVGHKGSSNSRESHKNRQFLMRCCQSTNSAVMRIATGDADLHRVCFLKLLQSNGVFRA